MMKKEKMETMRMEMMETTFNGNHCRSDLNPIWNRLLSEYFLNYILCLRTTMVAHQCSGWADLDQAEGQKSLHMSLVKQMNWLAPFPCLF